MQTDNKVIVGTIYYASKDAQRKRYYFEGRQIGTNNYHKAHWLSKNFVELVLDESGTNYIHMQVA